MKEIRNSIKTRVRAYGILLAADFIRNNLCAQLKELWNIYADARKTEYWKVHIAEDKIQALKHISNRARDFFSVIFL